MPGLTRDQHHRYFYDDGTRQVGPLPSVTTLIGILDKSGPLVGWAKRETAACAVRNLDMLNSMVASGGKAAAQEWLSKIPDFQRDEAADLGSRVHALAEAEIRGDPIQPTGLEVPFVRQWRSFMDDVQPQILYSEAMVANVTEGFAGTFDLGVLLDGQPTLLDIKTGKSIYPEVGLQLAGYDLMEFTAKPDDPTPVPLPKWTRYGVVHLQPDGWRLVPYMITDADRQAFRDAARLWHWNKSRAPLIMGSPVTHEILGGVTP